jgi:hypothetical protein
MEYGKSPKRVFIKADDHLYAKFLIKLKTDNIQQSKFFNALIEGYINDDPTIRKFLNESDGVHLTQRTIKKHAQEARKIMLEEYKFNLSQVDVDEIFDILEESDDDD